MREKISDLIKENFGLDVSLQGLSGKTGLPRYLISDREIFLAKADEKEFYVVRLKSPLDSRILAKEMAVYESILDRNVAFLFDQMNKNYRNAYVRHHIPFIYVPTQIYLPFLGILFGKRFAEESKERPVLSANAQQMLLWLIYHQREKYAKKQLAEKLGLNPVYVTRAAKELSSWGILNEYQEGRNVYVERNTGSGELKEKMFPRMSSPIEKVLFVARSEIHKDMPIAGDYALSEVGMLNPPDIPTYACYKKDSRISDLKIVDEPEWKDPETISRIELWSYDPEPLRQGNTIDIISLSCSLKDVKDARIQGEIDTLMEKYEWLL